MQRLRNSDEGAVGTLVAVLLAFGVLLGMGALVLDVGAAHAERRQLQNSADSAAIALAQSCAADAATCSTDAAAAQPWVNANAEDGLSQVAEVCRGAAGVTGSCTSLTTSGTLTDCLPPDPARQAGWSGFIEVRTQTQQLDGTLLLPPTMSRALLGNATDAGRSVGACARAAWGAVGGLGTIPLTISLCEWESMTADGTDFAPPPEPDGSYPAGYPVAYEKALHTHQGADGDAAGTCASGPANSDIAGGFGWLVPEGSSCEAYYDEDESGVVADPGASIPSECRHDLAPLVGQLLYIPIFNDVTAAPDRVYTIDGFAAFYLSGYGKIPSAIPNRVASIATGVHLCTGSEHCLYGWFTQALLPGDATIGSGGSDFGLTTTELSG